jgi:hypothetical protein
MSFNAALSMQSYAFFSPVIGAMSLPEFLIMKAIFEMEGTVEE